MSDDPEVADPATLKQGLTIEELTQAVRKSGYPLQTAVAHILQEKGFEVTEEWGYIDRTTSDHRSLDVFATLRLPHERLEPSFTLLVECKRSDLPYLFFVSAVSRVPDEFPTLSAIPWRRISLHRGDSYREVAIGRVLCAKELPFLSATTITTAFVRAERKEKKPLQLSGEEPFRQVVLPLASALDHMVTVGSTWEQARGNDKYWPHILLTVAVLDAPMFVVRGTPEQPKLTAESWVRVIRQEAHQTTAVHPFHGTRFRRVDYVVDFVHREFFRQFLMEHAMPFATEIGQRLIKRADVFMKGKASVPDWDTFTWDQVSIKP